VKTRTYKTINGKTIVALRPETEIEAELLSLDAKSVSKKIDSRHSFGDDREDQPVETKTNAKE